MSKQQTASQIAAAQMFVDDAFWAEVGEHLERRMPESTENEPISTSTDKPGGLSAARVRPVE